MAGNTKEEYKRLQKYSMALLDKKNEYVAMKVVEKAKLSTTGKDNIITEIKVMKMFKHKHIIEMKDFTWDDRNIYIILEYCDGGDLSRFIKSRQKLPEKICKKFLQQLAVGLQFLRSHNISHLDLKPQNLLLVTKPKLLLKIGDFGFAQFLSDSTQKSSIRGSPLYMAPEMLLGNTYDARADLWSIGVIAYECLFGKAPFSSISYADLYTKIKAKTPIQIPDNIGLSSDCRQFLTGLLKHDPKCRMSYDKFFSDPFLDLEHFPSEVSYRKAVNKIKSAEEFDKKKRYVDAFNAYCEALLYFLPILHDEINNDKKLALYRKVTNYTKRAEELKNVLKQSPSSSSESTDSVDGGNNPSSQFKNPNSSISATTKPNLFALCGNTPDLKSALEIGAVAQMYLVEGDYRLALEKFTSCLDILMKLLATEPPGIRKDLLHKQIQEWLRKAEITKSYLSLLENKDATPELANKEMCVIQ